MSGLAAAGSACSTTEASRADDAGAFDGGGAPLEAAATCASCVADGCLAPWSLCLLDGTCEAMHACGGARSCICGVVTQPGDGGVDPRAAYLAFARCNAGRTCGACASDCATACAAGPPADPPSCGLAATVDAGADGAACASCIASRCDDAKRACALGTECARFLSCAYACGDAACAEGCGRRFASGRESAVELSNCTLAGCRSSCEL